MYTQFRGVLCLSSIGQGGTLVEAETKFKTLREAYKTTTENSRAWVADWDTHIHAGSNASIWIFIGSEHKNYDESMMDWIKLLVSSFHCEGRIEIQYEEEYPGDTQRVLKITPGKIEEIREVAHTYGYGFSTDNQLPI